MKTVIPIMKTDLKRQNNWIIYFLSRDKTANKNMKRCSTILIIREVQIKITIIYIFISARMATFKK
jgi:hypothetical protein